jgi:hypothetical protein
MVIHPLPNHSSNQISTPHLMCVWCVCVCRAHALSLSLSLSLLLVRSLSLCVECLYTHWPPF